MGHPVHDNVATGSENIVWTCSGLNQGMENGNNPINFIKQ